LYVCMYPAGIMCIVKALPLFKEKKGKKERRKKRTPTNSLRLSEQMPNLQLPTRIHK